MIGQLPRRAGILRKQGREVKIATWPVAYHDFDRRILPFSKRSHCRVVGLPVPTFAATDPLILVAGTRAERRRLHLPLRNCARLIEGLNPFVAASSLQAEQALNSGRIFLRREKSNGKAILNVPDDPCDHAPHRHAAPLQGFQLLGWLLRTPIDRERSSQAGSLWRGSGWTWGPAAAVRRQIIWRNWWFRLAECQARLGVDVRRRACGAASGDVRWFVV